MGLFYFIKNFFTIRCRFLNTCDLYQKDNFNCEHQETGDAVSCGKWRNKIINGE